MKNVFFKRIFTIRFAIWLVYIAFCVGAVLYLLSPPASLPHSFIGISTFFLFVYGNPLVAFDKSQENMNHGKIHYSRILVWVLLVSFYPLFAEFCVRLYPSYYWEILFASLVPYILLLFLYGNPFKK